MSWIISTKLNKCKWPPRTPSSSSPLIFDSSLNFSCWCS